MLFALLSVNAVYEWFVLCRADAVCRLAPGTPVLWLIRLRVRSQYS